MLLALHFKKRPRGGVVFFSVGFEERCLIHNRALYWPCGLGGIGVGFADGIAGLEVLDVVPAEGDVLFGVVVAIADMARSYRGIVGLYSVGYAVGEVGFAGGAGEADVDEAFAGGEDDAAVLVVPGVGFVLAHDGELDTVDGEQFV